MDQSSPYALMQQLQREVVAILSAIDIYQLEPRLRNLAVTLRVQTADSRLDIRDYEYAETKVEQTRHGDIVRNQLDALRKNILVASEHGIFNAVDVVHLSTRIDGILERLE